MLTMFVVASIAVVILGLAAIAAATGPGSRQREPGETRATVLAVAMAVLGVIALLAVLTPILFV